MPDKLGLVDEIIAEFNLAQTVGLQSPGRGASTPFPPMISTGDGTHFAATDRLLTCVSEFADLLRMNDASVRNGFSEREFTTLVERSFGLSIQRAMSARYSAAEPAGLLASVEALVEEEVRRRKRSLRVFLGCSVIRELGAYPIVIGPAVFQTREAWLSEREASDEVSVITARRLRRAWRGSRIVKRKSGRDDHNERSILDAIGHHEIVCTVTTNSLTQKAAQEKAIQCARLSMTAVSLMWTNPQSALDWMHLKYDGEPHLRHFAVLAPGNRFISGGSSTSKLPGGIYADPSITATLTQFQPIFEVLGRALSAFVDADDVTTTPEVRNAILLALWWYHQGCREQSDHMAVVAFAASLDALAAGGKAKGIKELISSRLGIGPTQQLMADGRTTNDVVSRIYDAARSRFIHGSSVDYREDWSRLRGTASTLGRLTLVQVCDWIHGHPTVTDPKALRSP